MGNKQQSKLLQLPAEIRNDIFALALQGATLDIDAQYHSKATPPPGLVFACKQTYAETKSVYYSSLAIVSEDLWILEKWLDRTLPLLPSHRFSSIKQIYLDKRNRSEQSLPLSPQQRLALSHHSDLAVQKLKLKMAGTGLVESGTFDVKACIVTPSQELAWTSSPLATHKLLEST